MESFGINELLDVVPADLADIDPSDKLAIKYIAWKKLDKNDLSQMSFLGTVASDQMLDQNHPTDYWSPESVMSLSGYPYHGCKIYKNSRGNSYYFVYTEFGGHAPEERCRTIIGKLLTQ